MVFNSIKKALFPDVSQTFLKTTQKTVDQINALEESYIKLTDEQCKQKTAEFKTRLENGETLDQILPEAFALVREAAKRTLKQRHYDVQLIGGMALFNHMIAEMKTGEGKTLVATLPVYLRALTGKGVHVVTVNDYLAGRDASLMGQVYAFLGLTVGVINDNMKSYVYDQAYAPEEIKEQLLDSENKGAGTFRVAHEFLRPVQRKEAYACDITYGTNSEFGFDYLRDNTALRIDHVSQRGHYFALIDEVDSILIDEARVPLILSAQIDEPQDLYRMFASIAGRMQNEVHYTKDEKHRAVELTNAGIDFAEKELGITNMYTAQHIHYVHHLENAVKAQALFRKDKEYIVRDDTVVIIDEFTGRMKESSRWSDGMHQAVEAKEHLPIKAEARTIASITYQNYFKMYENLAGMTGTAFTSVEEFHTVYGLDVAQIPTHRPMVRIDNTDLIFINEKGKFKAIAKKIKELHEKNQPVLVGTASIEKNELLSAYLFQEGVPHQMLNAKNHEAESEIIAQAGKAGAVTIATNMAGRGVDIKLGGIPATSELEDAVRASGGLFVVGTERHEARRIDNQLRGRSGRQGDPGETQFFVSLEDHLLKVFGDNAGSQNLLAKMDFPEEQSISHGFFSKAIEAAQKRIEGFNFDSRKHILSFDDVLSFHRRLIYMRRKSFLIDDQNAYAELFTELKNRFPESAEQLQASIEKTNMQEYVQELHPIILRTIDRLWTDHLEGMNNVRQSVQLRAYGQKEPLVEYKKESLVLYRALEDEFYALVFGFINDRFLKESSSTNSEAQPVPVFMQSYQSLPDTIERNQKVRLKKGEEEIVVKAKKADDHLKDGYAFIEVVKD